eukprot:TRINITY_DN1453_c0_g1_i3.p1 TRINITY_DN1453_c0_g1~~TRINITY_DN1453_c0_g1_i3.p1  ORF type:complete len:174 (+),score=33.17 TRINITY_DN1453_c0_g1_i3:2-523(+)
MVVNNLMLVSLSGMLNFFFFQAEDGIRDLVRSRGLGDVYKRQVVSTQSTGKTWMVRMLDVELGLHDLDPEQQPSPSSHKLLPAGNPFREFLRPSPLAHFCVWGSFAFYVLKMQTGVPEDLSVCGHFMICLLYTSDAADEEDSVDLGGRRDLKKKKQILRHQHAAGDSKTQDEG